MSLENPIESNNVEAGEEPRAAELEAAEADPSPEADPVATEPGLGWVEMLYGIIARPAETLRVVSRGDYLVNALLIFLAVEGVSWFLQIAMAARGPTSDTLARLFPLLAAAAIPRAVVKLGMMMAVLGVLGSIIFLVAGAGIFNLLAEVLLRGKGNARGTLTGLALATLPTVFGAPFLLMASLFSWPIINLVSLVLWAWTLVLKVMAIREATEISTARAIAVYLIPGVSMALLLLIALVGGLVTLAPLVGGSGGQA
ncbi:MAG: YIP1 family protein [Firmicutes bacterium]|nr:YIP1 family protein [Bacillota bacterium]